jgi:hypothetical protein
MRSTEARRAGIDRPNAVARSFQVSLNKVEPTKSVLARNLLANDNERAVGFDEMEERWPQVPLVSEPAAFACRAERLARARAGPDLPVVWPSSPSKGVRPDADAGEEVTLGVLPKFIRLHVLNAALVDIAGSDVAFLDQVAEPLRRERIDLVVVSGHSPFSAAARLQALIARA